MSWERVNFIDVFKDITGGNDKVKSSEYQNNGTYPVIDQGKALIGGYTSNYSKVSKDDAVIIFGDHTSILKYIDFDFVLGADGVKVIEPDYKIIFPKYAFYALSQVDIPNTGYDRKFKYLKRSKIPLPPLPVQKKIAAILDAADDYRQKTKALIERYDALTQSLFLDMFGDPVTNPKGWEVKKITELVKKDKYSLKRGPFGGALKKEIFVSEGYLIYEQYHALNNDFSFARYFITAEKFEELKAFTVQSGDIIISCSGVYLGKLAIIPPDSKPGIINQALLKISLNETIMRNEFFVLHFSDARFKHKYFDSNRGAGIPNFPPMSTFKTFPFLCPPIEIQNNFLESYRNIMLQKQQVEASLTKAEELFQSLLQRAFKGELTISEDPR